MPDFVIDAHMASGALVQVLSSYLSPEGGFFVVRPAGEFAPRKVRVLIDIFGPAASP